MTPSFTRTGIRIAPAADWSSIESSRSRSSRFMSAGQSDACASLSPFLVAPWIQAILREAPAAAQQDERRTPAGAVISSVACASRRCALALQFTRSRTGRDDARADRCRRAGLRHGARREPTASFAGTAARPDSRAAGPRDQTAPGGPDASPNTEERPAARAQVAKIRHSGRASRAAAASPASSR